MEEVNESKYLGAILCKHLSMEGEIRERTVKGRQVMGALERVVKGRNVSMAVKRGIRKHEINKKEIKYERKEMKDEKKEMGEGKK